MERMEVTFSFMKKEYEIKDNDEHISRYERICAEKEDGIKEIEERRRKALEWAYRTHVGGEKQAASESNRTEDYSGLSAELGWRGEMTDMRQ